MERRREERLLTQEERRRLVALVLLLAEIDRRRAADEQETEESDMQEPKDLSWLNRQLLFIFYESLRTFLHDTHPSHLSFEV